MTISQPHFKLLWDDCVCTGTGNLDTGLRVTLLRFLRHPRLSSDEYGGMGVMPIEHHALSSSDEPDCGIP